MHQILINRDEIPIRADVLVSKNFPEYSRSALHKLFESSDIYDKYNIAVKPGDKIKPNELINVNTSILKKPIKNISIPIIYEDDNVIVIDKPAGILSHANNSINPEPSVASFIRSKVINIYGDRAGIVHRLDRGTSGVMICAKNEDTMKYLQKQFSSRKVSKTYYAIANGQISNKKIEIDIPVGRDPKNPKKFIATNAGKSALTNVELIKYIKQTSLLKIKPLTGRTHQIRVHLSYINHPIVGDEMYGGKKSDRIYLHAESLEINIPKGIRKIFNSKLPKEFLNE